MANNSNEKSTNQEVKLKQETIPLQDANLKEKANSTQNTAAPPKSLLTSFDNLSIDTPLPSWLTEASTIDDDFSTESSELLLQTAEECLPLLLGRTRPTENSKHGVSGLNRPRHGIFLRKCLGNLPAGFVGLDASRPWMLYWCLMALYSLGQDVSKYRNDLITTLKPLQNTTGGFGGGNGQYSHLATTYAAVLSLAITGGHESYEMIDRQALWHWLGRLKQPGGEFELVEDGESDVRGALCAMVLVSLLSLPLDLPEDSPARIVGTETFATGLGEWISQCQTYEGGLGNIPGSEAHGAFTFCGLACLCILGEPADVFAKYLDFPDLVRWLSARQHAPEGGLAGRTNKLVDNCYSHWVGGCWSLVEAAVQPSRTLESGRHSHYEGLFNREGLVRYILCCGQDERGGLRDKPGRPADAYHTQYGLAGLSSAQNYYQNSPQTQDIDAKSLPSAFQWTASKHGPKGEPEIPRVFNEEDRVSFMHPIYVIPSGSVEVMRLYFDDRPII